MVYDIVTFGEVMLRLSPPNFMRIEQTHTFDVHPGGAEASVAVACSRLGLNVAYVTKLPENSLGYLIRNRIREHGVDVDHILWDPSTRCGVYFYEFGASPRVNRVIYDRKNSAISQIKPGEIDWDKLFKNTKLYHVSGITPALSESAAKVTMESIEVAKKQGCLVSFDLNYRGKLWTPEAARKYTRRVIPLVDILIASNSTAEYVLDVKADSTDKLIRKVSKSYNIDTVVLTSRKELSVLRNEITASAYSKNSIFHSINYVVEIVDRLGGGDSFSAGFLYGYLKKRSVQSGLDYGVGMNALKHSIPGDINWTTVNELEELIKNGKSKIGVKR